MIPLLVWARRQPVEIVGIEILEEMADMASRSVRINDLSDKIRIVHGDLRDALDCLLYTSQSSLPIRSIGRLA